MTPLWPLFVALGIMLALGIGVPLLLRRLERAADRLASKASALKAPAKALSGKANP